jgi:CheY-like chemotaxis protein
MSDLFDGSSLRGVKALVVDDEIDHRELMDVFLTTCGIEVRTAASAHDALEIFASFRPTVLLSDIHMPDGDGFWLIRAIRALPPEEGGLTPAIAVSAGAAQEEVLGAGFHVHVTKPFDPIHLVDVIRDFAHESPGGKASWTIERTDHVVVLAWVGHVTGVDMRAGTRALADVLEAAGPCDVVSDLRKLTGFDPSAANVAENSVWRVRKNISSVTVLGGSPLARIVSKAACLVLGIPCTLA